MNQLTTCLHSTDVRSFLDGDMAPDDVAVAEQHLSTCQSCQQAIEQEIGSQQWWDGIRDSLRRGSEKGDARIPDARNSDEGQEARTSQLLELLGPTDDPNMLGRIGPYEIVGILGQGGMGAVFKGFDSALNRFVAIKVLLPHLAVLGAARTRFAREAQAAAAVVDDHVMAIHSVSEWQGKPYFVMPYARGVSLQQRLIDSGPLQVREILRIGMQTARALAAAHAQGIVHRDVKPANIFLEQGVERVQLMDFGLARAVDDASLTRTGTLAGTPHYMAPEQVRAEAVDARADLFSLGAVLYAMCSSHPPFRAETSYAVLRLITDREPHPVREINPDIPEWLSQIIDRLMSKEPSDRFASAGEVAELLEECLAHVQQPTAAPLPERLADNSQSQVRRAAGQSSRGPWTRRRLIATAFAFALAFAGILIVLETNKGKLTIESDADDVPIRIMQGDKMVEKLTVSKSGAAVRVAAGRYVVEIDGELDGIVVKDGMVDIQRRGRRLVRIVATPPAAALPTGAANSQLAPVDPPQPGFDPPAPTGAGAPEGVLTPAQVVANGQALLRGGRELTVRMRVDSAQTVKAVDATGKAREQWRLNSKTASSFTVTLSPQAAAALEQLGVVDVSKHFTAKVIEVRGALTVGVADPISSPETHLTYDITARSLGQIRMCRAIWLRTTPDPRSAAMAQLEQLKAMERSGRFDRAAAGYEKLYNRHRSQLLGLYARFYQARCQLKLGQTAEAKEILQGLLKQFPQLPAALRSEIRDALKTVVPNPPDPAERDDLERNDDVGGGVSAVRRALPTRPTIWIPHKGEFAGPA